ALAEAAATGAVATAVAAIAPESGSIVNLSASVIPQPRPEMGETQVAALVAPPAVAPVPTAPEVVTRMSTSGGRHWGINVGRFPSNATAERQLMTIALAESATLTDGLRKIVQRSGGYDANFMGLTQDQADLACRRLQARAVQCFAIGP
ncbi:MAG: D-alanyl-D-alanine carboxypeptidase, partial [Cereibacter changlensis]